MDPSTKVGKHLIVRCIDLTCKLLDFGVLIVYCILSLENGQYVTREQAGAAKLPCSDPSSAYSWSPWHDSVPFSRLRDDVLLQPTVEL